MRSNNEKEINLIYESTYPERVYGIRWWSIVIRDLGAVIKLVGHHLPHARRILLQLLLLLFIFRLRQTRV